MAAILIVEDDKIFHILLVTKQASSLCLYS